MVPAPTPGTCIVVPEVGCLFFLTGPILGPKEETMVNFFSSSTREESVGGEMVMFKLREELGVETPRECKNSCSQEQVWPQNSEKRPQLSLKHGRGTPPSDESEESPERAHVEGDFDMQNDYSPLKKTLF